MRAIHTLTATGLLLTIALPAGAATRYVNAAALPGGDGSSWATASNDLWATLQSAVSGDRVFIARGEYFTTTGTDATLNFRVHSGVQVYGGFAGTETDPSERTPDPDPEAPDPAHDTILSGEIGEPEIGDNAQDLLLIEGASPGAGTLVDRLVLTRGAPGTTFPSNRGGGARVSNSTATLRDTLFFDNECVEGGGLCVQSGAVTLERCVFKRNSAPGGSAGGALLIGGDTWLIDCEFLGNSASFSGGGLGLLIDAEATIRGCRFESNAAVVGGGAISSHLNSALLIEDCEFVANTIGRSPTAANGGAIHFNTGTHTVRRSRFEGNMAQSSGAVAVQANTAAAFEECDFIDNECDVSGGAAAINSAGCRFSDCLFQDNEAGSGGALRATVAVAVERCEFRGNFTHAPANYAGAVFLSGDGSTITDCDFIENSANAAAAVRLGGSGHEFDRCRFVGNTSISTSAALWHSSGSATYTNCLIAGNSAGFNCSTLFMQNSSSASMINCTVVGNTGGFRAFNIGADNSLTLANCIVRNPGDEFDAGAPVTATYSNIEGAFAGTGNIDADPLFVGVGLYTLDAGSPCVDAGSNSAVPVGMTIDLAGADRFIDDPDAADTGEGGAPIVDMGASERVPQAVFCLGDANNDGVVDFNDIASVLANWLSDYSPGTGLGDGNDDGVADFNDITATLANWLRPCE